MRQRKNTRQVEALNLPIGSGDSTGVENKFGVVNITKEALGMNVSSTSSGNISSKIQT